MGGVQTEEDAAAHDGAVHDRDDLEAGGEEVEQVLGPVDVDQVQTVSLLNCVQPLPSDRDNVSETPRSPPPTCR